MLSYEDIAQLAHLLRVCAITTRQLSTAYLLDVYRMSAVARQLKALADELDDYDLPISDEDPEKALSYIRAAVS